MTFRMARDSVRLMRADNGDWLPVDPAMFAPFIKYRVDTAKAHQVLRDYNFHTFKLWLKARHAMAGANSNHYTRDPRYSTSWNDTLNMLREGGENWEQLYKEFGQHAYVLVRDAIYKVENCIIKVEVPSIAGYDVSSVQASANKWRRLSNQF